MAGLIVAAADRGGMVRETFAMGKAYGEARKQHGNSELLDAIVAAKPERDHTRFHSYDELKRHGLQLLQEAVATLEGHATAEEVDEYRRPGQLGRPSAGGPLAGDGADARATAEAGP